MSELKEVAGDYGSSRFNCSFLQTLNIEAFAKPAPLPLRCLPRSDATLLLIVHTGNAFTVLWCTVHDNRNDTLCSICGVEHRLFHFPAQSACCYSKSNRVYLYGTANVLNRLFGLPSSLKRALAVSRTVHFQRVYDSLIVFQKNVSSGHQLYFSMAPFLLRNSQKGNSRRIREAGSSSHPFRKHRPLKTSRPGDQQDCLPTFSISVAVTGLPSSPFVFARPPPPLAHSCCSV